MKITSVPERIIAQYAMMYGIDDIAVIDRLEVRGDNVFMSLRGLVGDDDPGWAWVWSREDEEEDEEDDDAA